MKLTFFNLASLRTGRGCEQVILQLIKYKPADISVTVVETDFLDGERISKETIEKLTSKVDVITIRTRVKFLNNFFVKHNFLVKRLRLVERKLAKLDGHYDKIRSTDLVYLLANDFSSFFSKVDIPIIGSNHVFNPRFYFHKGRISRAKIWFFKRIMTPIFYKNINGYHMFPMNANFLKNVNTKYNFILPNGVDAKLYFPTTNLRPRKIKFLFVAALTPQKGLDILIPLIKEFSNYDLEFHIAGQGPLENELRQMPGLFFHGVLDDFKLSKLFRDCDIFIYPSHNDTYSLVVLQALSSGLYVLCGDYLRGCFDDFAKLESLEYISLEIGSFRKRINEWIHNNNWPIVDKNKTFDYVKENYDWQVISEKFYDHIRTIYKSHINDGLEH